MLLYVKDKRQSYARIASHLVAILWSEVDSAITEGRFNPGLSYVAINPLAIFLREIISVTLHTERQIFLTV